MIEQLKTIREDTEWINNCNTGGMLQGRARNILEALAQLEAMVGEQEPVAWVLYFTNEHWESMREPFFSKAHVEMHKAHNENFRGLKCRVEPLYTAAPVAQQPQAEASPTAGMNMAQRILHVGGRNNAAGYVEFGSIQAVEALVRQVLRDLPKPRRIPDHELVTMYDECPRSDSDMLAFAHEVMGAMLAPPQQAEAVSDCGEAGHDEGCCGNRDCLPSARKKAPQKAEAVPSGVVALLQEAREALWQPSNPELCERIDAAIAQQKGASHE